MAKFVKVGRVGDLADGQAKVVQVDGQRIALFYVGGRYYALEAACPHEGGPLADGVIEGLRIVCPWHGYDFHFKTGECGLDPPTAYSSEIRHPEVKRPDPPPDRAVLLPRNLRLRGSR
ncbi:MAG: Rieske 2Fe-2S domain-containing protein [candidate division NC10 bacterium]|nr:Rieske 2Fe-2S domain-containing protein [candidate division NC10 bacterium]